MASSNNSTYRTFLAASQGLGNGIAAGTYFLSGSSTPLVSGVDVGSTAVPLLTFAKSEYEVGGKTQKLQIRALFAQNSTKPAITFTLGLYPVTVAGGANELKLTLGTVVSGSKVEVKEPSASTVVLGLGSNFTIPEDGNYALGVVTSGTLTANARLLISAQLTWRSV